MDKQETTESITLSREDINALLDSVEGLLWYTGGMPQMLTNVAGSHFRERTIAAWNKVVRTMDGG